MASFPSQLLIQKKRINFQRCVISLQRLDENVRLSVKLCLFLLGKKKNTAALVATNFWTWQAKRNQQGRVGGLICTVLLQDLREKKSTFWSPHIVWKSLWNLYAFFFQSHLVHSKNHLSFRPGWVVYGGGGGRGTWWLIGMAWPLCGSRRWCWGGVILVGVAWGGGDEVEV